MRLRRHSLAEWWQLIRSAAVAWSDDHAPSMGAALSYYSVFSMAPLLFIVISIAGLVFGEEAARGEVFAQLSGLLGADSAQAIEQLLGSLRQPSRGLASVLLSSVVLLIGATTVFGELQDALDRIWRAPARDRSTGLWGLVRARLLSFGMILGIAFLLMVSLVLSAAISALGKWWGGFFDDWEILLQVGNAALGFIMTAAVFGLIYKLMPRVKVEWHDVWLGALATSAMFSIGRFLIGLYIGKTGVASGFGAAGSIAVVFVWVYYSAQIFLLGAEFTWVYAKRFGSMRTAASQAFADAPAPKAASVPAAATSPVAARTSQRPLPPKSALLPLGVGLGVAAVVRFVLPRVVLRLTDRAMNR